MPILVKLLRTFFSLLYHQFAWTYDFVAGLASLGQWDEWVGSVLPFLDGQVLEIGFGPGHLQQLLVTKGCAAYGLDESPQMAKLTSRRLYQRRYPIRLARGYAQNIPFPDGSFDNVVATFPSEYIFDLQTLREIRRVLVADGKLVIVPSAWITGTGFLERLAAWVFQITGQASPQIGRLAPVIRDRFGRAGFSARTELIRLKKSCVLVVLAAKAAYN
jgi:ubiquinone/menaquinone biosynthesis C-methylase UbiE